MFNQISSEQTILITKETRAGESRVSMIPKDVKELVEKGYKVFVEYNAGKAAGFSDGDYEKVGASIRVVECETLEGYKNFFKNVNIVVRAKRPDRNREILEYKAMEQGTIMIGALDPLEKNSPHMDEYHQGRIIAYSIDQLNLKPDDPMNLLAAMSKIAGKLSLLDAINKFKSDVKKIVIIGFGIVGKSAFEEALNKKIKTTVILTNALQAQEVTKRGAFAIILNKNDDLKKQQTIIRNELLDADIVITSARRSNQVAPILIPNNTLTRMKKGAVIVDMALSEGGNVEGSEHDATHILGNEVIVTNTSGYPKYFPNEASKLWSYATLLFINKLSSGTFKHL